MTSSPPWLPLLAATAVLIVLSCSSAAEAPPVPTATEAPAATATLVPTSTPAPTATATPAPVRQDIRATRLAIPTLNVDAEVQLSETVPYTYTPPLGCPPRPQDTETLTVPSQGIATPADNLEGLENKAWILGHSRWLGTPGLFLSLQEIDLGDELVVDGVDRSSGEAVVGQRYVVDGIYLTDVDSGSALINADGPDDIPTKPIVILQTSVREDGLGKEWILSREPLLAKATNLVEGDLDDHCKYLLLFVTASPA
jgi:hypothetical protein